MTLPYLLKKGGYNFLARAAGAGLTFLLMIFFARVLGVDQFGLFSLSLTIVGIASVIGRWGLEQLSLKQVSIYIENNCDYALSYLYSSILFSLIISSVLVVFLYTSANYLQDVVFKMPQLGEVIKLFSFGIIPITLLVIISEAYKAIDRSIWSSVFQTSLPALMVIFLSVLLIQLEVFNFHCAIILYWLCFLFSFLVAFIWWYFLLYRKASITRISWKILISEGWPRLLITSGGLMMAWTDILVLGVYQDEATVGIYIAASKIVLLTSILLTAMNSLTAPKFSKLFSEKKLNELKILAQKSTAILAVMAIISTVVLFIFSERILMLFGQEFVPGAGVLMILAIGQLVNVACGSVGYLLIMTGHEKKMRNIMLSMAMFNMILSLSLVQDYGMYGVATATAVSLALLNIWAVFAAKKRLGFWMLFQYKS